jgi:hypothetical protein
MCGTFASARHAKAPHTWESGLVRTAQSALAPTEVLRETPIAQHTPITRGEVQSRKDAICYLGWLQSIRPTRHNLIPI